MRRFADQINDTRELWLQVSGFETTPSDMSVTLDGSIGRREDFGAGLVIIWDTFPADPQELRIVSSGPDGDQPSVSLFFLELECERAFPEKECPA